MSAMSRAETLFIAASISEGLRRKEGGENLSNFSESSRTAVSPRVSMSFSVDSTIPRTLASSSARSAAGFPLFKQAIVIAGALFCASAARKRSAKSQSTLRSEVVNLKQRPRGTLLIGGRLCRLRDADQLAIDELADTDFTQLAPVARVLDAAKRRLRPGVGIRIDENHAGFDLRGHLLRPFHIGRENRRAEAEWRFVGQLDGFLFAIHSVEGEHRTERLLLTQGTVLADVRDDRRFEVEAGAIQPLATKHDLRTCRFCAIDLRQQPVEPPLREERADRRCRICRIAGFQRAPLLYQPRQDFVGALLADDDHTLRGDAGLAHVVHASLGRLLNGPIQRCVVQNDHWVAATEFQHSLLHLASRAFSHRRTSQFAARHRSTAIQEVANHGSDLFDTATQVRVYALWRTRLLKQPGEGERTLRDRQRMFEHDDVARDKLRAGHSGKLVIGEIPRLDRN